MLGEHANSVYNLRTLIYSLGEACTEIPQTA